MADVTIYSPSGAPVLVSDTPASYKARLLARGYTEAPPGPAPVIYTKTSLGSAARTESGESGAIPPDVRAVRAAEITFGLQVTAKTGTDNPALIVRVQWFSNAAGAWFDQDPSEAFTAKTEIGAWMKTMKPRGDLYRVVWTITGTTPSFTFAVLETGPLDS